ncbi:MAG: c-type cytochrome [Chitinophagaceae bacterium]
MKKLKITLLIVSILFSISSCYYDKEELIYGLPGDCPTKTTVSYANNVVPLFQQKCYGCHASGNGSGGISMGTYDKDMALAKTGKLYGSIAHSSGYSAMPQGASKLSTCQIATVKAWIDANYPNN